MTEIGSLQVKSGDKTTSLSFIDDKLQFEWKKRSCGFIAKNNLTSIPVRNILSVTLDNKEDDNSIRIIIKALVPKGKLKLKLEDYLFEVIDGEAAQSWTNAVNSIVYKDTKQAKRLKVFVNPFGGSGKAVEIFNKSVKPIFDAAGCIYDVTFTERLDKSNENNNNAKRVARDLNLNDFDAIVAVSGDGIIHEIINGLLSRDDALQIDIPIGTIPAGSGNALSISLLGNDHGVSVPHAALNVIKGVPMKIDVCSVTQGDEKYFAFMTLNYGLSADADLSTDHLRWMKDFRFFLGAFQALLGNRHYKCRLAIKIAEDNTERIKQGYNEAYKTSPSSVSDINDNPKTLLNKYGTVKDPIPQGWTVSDEDGHVFFAGKIPWVTRDTLVFPFALPSDGLLDLVVIKRDRVSRLKVLRLLIESLENNIGEVDYYKVEAFRLIPLNERGYISIDGESVPFEPFQVEVHPKLISVIGVDGRYAPTST